LRHAFTATAAVVVGLIGGCGGGADFANDPRPPSPINVSAVITADRVTVTPTHFGAGPVVILIANETPKTHRLTVQTEELGASKPGVRQSTAAINPQGTATLKVDMTQGRYSVGTGESGMRGAHLRVKGKRTSAQSKVLQP
jgi:hypothetical protein